MKNRIWNLLWRNVLKKWIYAEYSCFYKYRFIRTMRLKISLWKKTNLKNKLRLSLYKTWLVFQNICNVTFIMSHNQQYVCNALNQSRSVSSAYFPSIMVDGKYEFLKSWCFTLIWGILCAFLVLYWQLVCEIISRMYFGHWFLYILRWVLAKHL